MLVWFLGSEDNFPCVHQCKYKASVRHADIVLLKYDFSLTLGQGRGRHVTLKYRKKLLEFFLVQFYYSDMAMNKLNSLLNLIPC